MDKIEYVLFIIMAFIVLPILFYLRYNPLSNDGVESVRYSFSVNMNSGDEYIIDGLLVGKCDSNKKCTPFTVMAKEHGCTGIRAIDRADACVKITCTNFVEGIKQ